MDNQKLASALEALVEALRGDGDAPSVHADDAAVALGGGEGDVASTDIVEIEAGTLWLLINRARKMIRLAREGKVPSQQDRAPLCDVIKAIKDDGLAVKPYDID